MGLSGSATDVTVKLHVVSVVSLQRDCAPIRTTVIEICCGVRCWFVAQTERGHAGAGLQ